jgi:hypothetical protein
MSNHIVHIPETRNFHKILFVKSLGKHFGREDTLNTYLGEKIFRGYIIDKYELLKVFRHISGET